MTVKLVGTFFSSGGAWSSYNFGDLYISSTGWHVSTNDPPHFASDKFTAGEGWNYVVTAGGVYALDFNSIIMTDSTYTGNGGRAYQAWRGGYGTFIENATVTPPNSLQHTDFMSFTFDDAFLGNPLNVGLHWTMICGNDGLREDSRTFLNLDRCFFLGWASPDWVSTGGEQIRRCG